MANLFAVVRQLDGKIDLLAENMHGRRVRFYPSIVGPVVFSLLAVAIFILMPSQIKVLPDQTVNARAFPELMAGIMLVCSLAVLLVEIVKVIRKQRLETKELDLLTECKALILLGLFVGYALLMEATGFISASVIYALSMLYYFRIKTLKYYVIVALSAISIGLIFQHLLNVRLP